MGLVAQSCQTLCNSMDYSPERSSVQGDSPGRILELVAMPSPPGYLPNPGNEPRSPALQEDSLPSEPPRKSKNTGVDSLSLLQGIFLIQESTQGLLHCRQTLYQLSYQADMRQTALQVDSELLQNWSYSNCWRWSRKLWGVSKGWVNKDSSEKIWRLNGRDIWPLRDCTPLRAKKAGKVP